MKFYVEKLIPADDVVLFKQIRRAVRSLPELELGLYPTDTPWEGEKILVSCHMLARSVSKVFKLPYVDGLFGGVAHSWLVTKNGNNIDVYPMGILGGPILVKSNYTGTQYLYERTSARRVSRGTFSSVWFKLGVRRLTYELRHPRLPLRFS